MRYFALGLAALIVVGMAGAQGRADFTFQFADTTGTAQTNFTVAQGSTVGVEVFLVETNGGATLSNPNGLQSAGVQLSFNSSIATVPNTAAIAGGPGFDDVNPSVGAGTATLNEDSTGATVSSTSNRILLGTFTFTGMSAGSTETLTSDPHPGFDDTVDNSGNVLDSMIANASAVITVTAVPEPGGMVLTGLAALLIGLIAWLRWRNRPIAAS